MSTLLMQEVFKHRINNHTNGIISKCLITSKPKQGERLSLFYLNTIYKILDKSKFNKAVIETLKNAKIVNLNTYEVNLNVRVKPTEIDYLLLPNSLYYWGYSNRPGVKIDFNNAEEEQRVKEAIYSGEYISPYLCLGVNYKIEYFVNGMPRYTTSLELSKIDNGSEYYVKLFEEQQSLEAYFKNNLDPTELSNTDEIRCIENGVFKVTPSSYDKWRLIIKALS